MPVHVDQLTTEVFTEPQSDTSVAPSPHEMKTWDTVEGVREAYCRWMRDRQRTAAEGFDD